MIRPDTRLGHRVRLPRGTDQGMGTSSSVFSEGDFAYLGQMLAPDDTPVGLVKLARNETAAASLGEIFRRPCDARVREARLAGELVHPRAARPPA